MEHTCKFAECARIHDTQKRVNSWSKARIHDGIAINSFCERLARTVCTIRSHTNALTARQP